MDRHTLSSTDHTTARLHPLFTSLWHQTMSPCALHLILSMHRLFWKVIHTFTKTRSQEHRIAPALRKIGCHYIALQCEAYFKSKGKFYDGSKTLKPTGNDCKRLEEKINAFTRVFLQGNETLKSISAAKLSQFRRGVQLWLPIARELRDCKTSNERVGAFGDHVLEFSAHVKKYFPSECSKKMIYFHILQDHIHPLLKFWRETMKWGYGMFSGTAGEHLNKRCKQYEMDHTNQGGDRFLRITHHFRCIALHFPQSVIHTAKSNITCSACGLSGHNKKNKICSHHEENQNAVDDISESDRE